MIFEWLFLSIILFVSMVLQLTLIPVMEIWGVQADIVFAVVIAIGIYGGMFKGSIFGVCAGLLFDILFSSPGMFSLQYTFAGVFSGILGLWKHGLLRPAVVALPVCAVKEGFILFLLYLRRCSINWTGAFANILISAVYTAVFVLLFGIVLSRLRNRYGFFDRNE